MVNSVHPNQTLQHLLTDFNMSPTEKVNRLLGLRGMSQKDLARELKRNPVYVSEVLASKRVSAPVKREIAAFFNLNITDIWPPPQA